MQTEVAADCQASVDILNGVGPALREKLERLSLHTLQDLLFHLPLRYEDRTRLWPLAEVVPGMGVLTEGLVYAVRVEPGRRRSLWVGLEENGARLGLRFYSFSRAQQAIFVQGARIRCFGEVREGRSGPEMYHPQTQRLRPGQHLPPEGLVPVYPVTEGVGQARMRKLIGQALELLSRQPLPDFLAGQLPAEWTLPDLNSALQQLHRPLASASPSWQEQCRARLVLEELLAHHHGMLDLRRQQRRHPARACQPVLQRQEKLQEVFGFQLTRAQTRVVHEVMRDLGQTQPMLRLVQGDVGSGKTVVAALAALAVIDSGAQVALMAPTELLAEQHAGNFSRWFEGLGVRSALLTGRIKPAARREILADLQNGTLHLVIGTHALFQQSVEFACLGLTIIDEQHRFGVHQRLALQDRGQQKTLPHQLIMTATPIPRTLAMTAFGDLDVSIIDERPPGRLPVTTRVLSQERRHEVMERLRSICAEGRQVYWVCTLIEESEALQCQAAENCAAELAQALPELRVGLTHGRQNAEEKSRVMQCFARAELDVLVATTVVEVGVDVPNATLMVIENPERLGLAQLHQLRGRVGRGYAQSYCLLLYGEALSEEGRSRLQVLRDSEDGFVIAEADFQLRGPGDWLGTRQTGMARFRLADLHADHLWLERARVLAEQQIPLLSERKKLLERWLGSRLRYGRV